MGTHPERLPERLIDARGMRCPWPVLRLARAAREGEAPVTILADDPIAPAELAKLCDERGWRLQLDAADPVRFTVAFR